MAYWLTEPMNNPTPAMPRLDARVQKSNLAAYQALTRGEAVDPAALPEFIICDTGHTKLPDFFSVTSGVWGVSEKARDVLLNAAPNDIEFYPFRVENVRGWSLQGHFFFMNVTSHRDSVVWEKTTLEITPPNPEYDSLTIVYLESSDPSKVLVLDRAKLKGVDAWHERLLGSYAACTIFISDRLKELIVSSDLKPIKFNWVQETEPDHSASNQINLTAPSR